MKQILIISLVSFVINSCAAQDNLKDNGASIDQLNWLIGNWTRINNKPGRSGLEQWQKKSGDEFRGLGINMRGQDTLFVEKISILKKDGALYYVADVPENVKPVYFKMTEVNANGFVCENPQHDFPKKISYHLEGVNLLATISGDGKSIDYHFVKKRP